LSLRTDRKEHKSQLNINPVSIPTKETQQLTTHETDKKVNRICISNGPQACELIQYIAKAYELIQYITKAYELIQYIAKAHELIQYIAKAY